MTTGSLKLMSLLVVIAAGGGVAWQVQQGLLRPQTPEAESTAEDTNSEVPDADASPDPFADEVDDIAAADDDPSPDSEHLPHWTQENVKTPARAVSTPSKFQRTTKTERSLGPAIPARVARNDRTDTAEDTASDSPDLPDLNGESASDPFADQDEPQAADPVDGSSPVLLVGNEDTVNEPSLDDGFPTLSDTEAMTDDESAPMAADIDDPFAGAAPPDLGEEESLPETISDSPADLGTAPDAASDGPSLFPSRRGKPETSPLKSRSTSSKPEPVTDREAPESTGLQPKLGMPTDSPPADFDDDPFRSSEEARSSRTESLPSRSRRLPKAPQESADDAAPRLLPVPDVPSKSKTPRLPTDLDLDRIDREDPKLGDFGPKDMPLQEDELNGDATFDPAAPRGLQQPRLTIEKIAPKQAIVGQPLVYSVVVRNAGSADAHQVTVEDRIPKGTKLEGTSPRAELIDKKLVWRLGTLKPDEQKKISIKLIPLEQGPIGSIAKVNFVAEIAAEIEVTAPQILVSIDGPSQVRLGDKLHLVFKIRNAGGADAQNVVVRNMIPDGLRHPAGADLEYAMGTLPANDSREIQLDLVATKNGEVTNKTIITADGVHVETETPVEVIGEQLLLTRTGKSRLFVDKPAVFTSTVANEGTAEATKVMVAEVVPAGLEFVSASDNGQYDPVTRAVTWSVGPIGPGEELKLSTKLMPRDLGDYRATVTVTGPAGSVATVDAELKVDGFPTLAVESKSNARLISVGEKATIRITCRNQGTAAAKNLVFSADLPPELKLVDANGPSQWDQQGNVVTFEAVSHLDPNEAATFDLQVEGVSEGDTRIETQIAADYLKRPLRRDEDIRIAP